MSKQANALHCFVCGVRNPLGLKMKFYEHQPGEVSAEIVVPEQYQGYPGVVHGGVIAAMLDEVSGRSFMGGGPPRFLVTARLNIRYRKPVPVGARLMLKGHAGEDRGRVALATGEIYNEAGDLLAEAEIVLAEMPGEVSAQIYNTDDGWRVYPDEENDS